MQYINILVVDDEPGIRSGIRRILEKFTVDYPFMDDTISFVLYDASTGEEAIEYVKHNPTDIVLLDNKLPGIQGIEVLEFINQQYPEILVLMITSHASLDTAIKATQNGAYDFVPKPFTPQELKSSVETCTKQLFLRKMTRQLYREGKQIRFQFLSMLSHELKTPINTLEGYLNMMKERQMGGSIEDYGVVIDRSLERIRGMRNLIMDLLDLTQIETGKTKREVKMVNIPDILQSSIESMKPYAIQRDVKCTYSGPEKLNIQADSEDIEIIFNNLISNAIKYNSTNGQVLCELKDSDTHIEVSVKDTGMGIRAEDLPKIFNEFFRIKNQETKNISGTGLGLSIVKRLVEEYHGSIEADSNIGEGTTFRVHIPKAFTQE